MHSFLEIKGFNTKAKLGWDESERQFSQSIRFNISIRFVRLPVACLTDHLSDTVCYQKLTGLVTQVCSQGEYRLIEHLGYRVYEELRCLIPAQASLCISIQKVSPPIEGLTEGAWFTIDERREVI